MEVILRIPGADWPLYCKETSGFPSRRRLYSVFPVCNLFTSPWRWEEEILGNSLSPSLYGIQLQLMLRLCCLIETAHRFGMITPGL
ncbi:unnamed protein product [Citrullus colocynthis]|uniref:Uncharacterized protein n=1 Tax=Citrullus colocynthis TaxID=252529 RepID=A0ABP0Z1E2_9ROSI